MAKAKQAYGYRELSHGLSDNPLGDLSKSWVVAEVFADPGSYTPPAAPFSATGASAPRANAGNDKAIAAAFGSTAPPALSGTSLGGAAASLRGIGGQATNPPSARSIAATFASLGSAAPNPVFFAATGRTKAPSTMAFSDPGSWVPPGTTFKQVAMSAGKATTSPLKAPKPTEIVGKRGRSNSSGFPDPLASLFGTGAKGKRRLLK